MATEYRSLTYTMVVFQTVISQSDVSTTYLHISFKSNASGGIKMFIGKGSVIIIPLDPHTTRNSTTLTRNSTTLIKGIITNTEVEGVIIKSVGETGRGNSPPLSYNM